ncbi:MAG: sigma-70 family RNA polymerase sigma factor [Candidatus Methylomirabilaceae bacterium]
MHHRDIEATANEFERLALPHLPLAYRVAYRLAGNRADAEDLVQDAFLKAYQGFQGFRYGTNFRAWLLTILRHAHVDRMRKRAVEPSVEPWNDLHHVVDGSRDTIQSIETALDGAMGEEVERALQSVPLQQRLAVVLADLEEMSYEEIAKTLGCPIGTVRSRLHHGRALLRQHLREFAKGRGYVKP